MLGLVRGGAVASYNEGQQATPAVNPRGEWLVSQGLPERSELVRMGNSYSAQIALANAFTFVAALPTTRAELVVYNAAASGGKSLLIDRAWMLTTGAQTAAQHMVLLGQLSPSTPVIAAPTDGTTTIVQTSLLGNKGVALSRVGVAKFALANTAFALADHWAVLGQAFTTVATTNIGASVTADVYGRYIVTPGAAFCLAGLASGATGTAVIGVEYHEAQLQLG